MQHALVVLAAGKGTRMKSDLPKVLHPLAGAPLVIHTLNSAALLDLHHSVVVVGHGAQEVETCLKGYAPDVQCVLQAEQLGTAHAVAQARVALEGFAGDVFVLYGDTPLILPETLQDMAAARAKFDLVVLGFKAQDPGKYGRLVMRGETLERIVEFKDATAQEREIDFCNSGVLVAQADVLLSLIEQVSSDNAAGEYYLTDVIALAAQQGLSATAIECLEEETLGVNSRVELAQAEAVFQTRARRVAMESGVSLQAPDTVYFSYDTKIAADCVVEPHVVFGPAVTIDTGCAIKAFSHLEGCQVAANVMVGPFARLRPGAILDEKSKVGNFVEVKNAHIEAGAKINHLSYVGDADVGRGANVGAGTVTCNYDGVLKHKTTIGEQAFIGSGTMLVAPVEVGDHALTASGSVITDNVPSGALAFGRAQQVNKPNLAVKLFQMLRAKKARLNKDLS